VHPDRGALADLDRGALECRADPEAQGNQEGRADLGGRDRAVPRGMNPAGLAGMNPAGLGGLADMNPAGPVGMNPAGLGVLNQAEYFPFASIEQVSVRGVKVS